MQKSKTFFVHCGREIGKKQGFVNTPIYKGSTILFPTVEALEEQTCKGIEGIAYGRQSNPTAKAFECAVAELEGAAHAKVTSSGLAAVTTTFLSLLHAHDHVLIVDSVFQPTRKFADEILTRLGVEVSYYPPDTNAGIKEYLRPNTKLVLLESPGSNTFEIQDVPQTIEVIRQHNKDIYVAIDNTWATGLYFPAFKYGVDISILAATKYILGHSDALLGVITANDRAWPHILHGAMKLGISSSQEDCFLALRGLRTLELRLKQHQENGILLASWFTKQPEVKEVLHPSLVHNKYHQLWRRDFSGACGLFGVIFHDHISFEAIKWFINHLNLFGLGFSWGGYESLILPCFPHQYRKYWACKAPIVRVHAGLEDVDDLIKDLEEGFAYLRQN